MAHSRRLSNQQGGKRGSETGIIRLTEPHHLTGACANAKAETRCNIDSADSSTLHCGPQRPEGGAFESGSNPRCLC